VVDVDDPEEDPAADESVAVVLRSDSELAADAVVSLPDEVAVDELNVVVLLVLLVVDGLGVLVVAVGVLVVAVGAVVASSSSSSSSPSALDSAAAATKSGESAACITHIRTAAPRTGTALLRVARAVTIRLLVVARVLAAAHLADARRARGRRAIALGRGRVHVAHGRAGARVVAQAGGASRGGCFGQSQAASVPHRAFSTGPSAPLTRRQQR
jgi:hypothetical protein